MGKEIERKFLVGDDQFRDLAEGILIRQGYLVTGEMISVRVRTIGEEAFLAVKGPTISATRDEYEYQIPFDDALEIMRQLCEKPIIEKHRYIIEHKGYHWEVDEFHGMNEGLVVAEVELDSEDEAFEKPPWIGEEVTGDERYYNVNLVKNPFIRW